MTRYLLDTHTASHLLKGHPRVALRISTLPMSALCISAVTQGELMFGLARRPDAVRLREAVNELLLRVDTLPWDRAAASQYGELRATMSKHGKVLAPLDLLIAAHALCVGAVLVSSDAAFAMVPSLALEDWTA